MIRLNEVALRQLLESQTGPVGRDLEERAERITRRARGRVAIITARSPVEVENDVDFVLSSNPLQAVIGIRDTGSITRYLAAKESREGGVWLLPSLAEEFTV